MFRIKTTLIYPFILAIPFLILFFKFNIQSNAAAFTLDQNTLNTLSGTSSSAYNQIYNYGMIDPTAFVFSGSQLYDEIDNALYNSTGWDIESTAWYYDDSLNPNTIVQNLTKGAFQNLAQATAEGYTVLSTTANVGWTQAKNYILAKVNSATGKITETYNNVYTKITDTFSNTMQSTKSNLKNDGDIVNYTNYNFTFTKSATFYSNYDFNVYHVEFDTPIVFFTDNTDLSTLKQIFIMYPYDWYISEHLDTTNSYCIGTSGSYYNVSAILVNQYHQVVINGTNYVWYPLQLRAGTYTAQVHDYHNLMDYNDVIQFIASADPYSQNIAYEYGYSNTQAIYDLLDSLSDKWVTSEDLKLIYDKLDSLSVINDAIDGTVRPVIEIDSEAIAEIESIIEGILERNADINDEAVSPDPEPEPDININQGIDIPTGFNGDILTSFKNIITLPTIFFSVFEPLFKILGSNPAILGLWLFFPVFLLIVFVIWALK